MYTFKNFTTLTFNEIENVLHLRNQSFIREWMFNNNIITWEEHIAFIKNLKNDSSKTYLYVMRDDEFIGVYSVNEIKNCSGQAGFYISMEARKQKLAFEFLYFCLDYIFQSTTIAKLYGFEAIDNTNAFTLNKLFGFYANIDQHLLKNDQEGFRYGELTQSQFNQLVSSNKIRRMLKFSNSIVYKFIKS